MFHASRLRTALALISTLLGAGVSVAACAEGEGPHASAERELVGTALGAACVADTCGDGQQDAFEACDDGNLSNTDACLTTCNVAACGDGYVQAGSEDCDDGNALSGDGCSPACGIEPSYVCTGTPSACVPDTCGDGHVDPGEACDDGNDTDTDACRNNCSRARCGDGVMWHNPAPYDALTAEQCDDGNTIDGDGCSAQCVSETCGDGVLQDEEYCDTALDPDCPDTCRFPMCSYACSPGLCGGNAVCSSENIACDDGPVAECVGNCMWWTTCTAIWTYPSGTDSAQRLEECVEACKLL